MAAYLRKAEYAAKEIKKLENDYPGILHDPRIYNLLYTANRAMPRVQSTVKQNYCREVARLTGAEVRISNCTRENYKGEEYQDIEFTKVEKDAFGNEK